MYRMTNSIFDLRLVQKVQLSSIGQNPLGYVVKFDGQDALDNSMRARYLSPIERNSSYNTLSKIL